MPRADARGRRATRQHAIIWLIALALLAGCSGAGRGIDPEPPGNDSARPAPTPEVPELPDDPPASESGSDPGPGPDPEDGSEAGSGSSASATPPPPPASRDALIARSAALLAAAGTDAESRDFSVAVVDEYGREILAHRADEPLLPASTLKIVTAAAALSTFGSGATFGTRVEVTAPVDGNGVLDGELVLIGSGDPVLATEEYGRWVYPARPRTPLEELADAIAAAGVTRIRGDLVGIADGFDGPKVATGWPDRYFSSMDARFADGLSVDAGLRTILSYPAPADPDPEVDADDGQNADASTDAGEEGDDPDRPVGLAGSEVPPPGVDPIVRVDHADDPAAHAVGELGRLLVDRGVEVLGETRSGEPSDVTVGRLARVESPPLEELLRFAVQRSDNQIADAVFRAVGRARTGTGSFASGDRALRQVLDRYGIVHTGSRFADGSGLSRDDRATTRLLVELDRAMRGSRHAGTWSSLMAVTGRSGTLESRLSGTMADGRFAGKTGTLRDVTGLVGTVLGDGTRRYHLSVIANDGGAARWVSRALADDLILLLVADLDGCVIGVTSEVDATLGRLPSTVSC